MFDSTTREIDNTNIFLRHLLLEAIGKKLGEKKLNLITLMDLISEILAMHSIKIMAKLNSIIHQVESEDWFECKKKTRSKSTT